MATSRPEQQCLDGGLLSWSTVWDKAMVKRPKFEYTGQSSDEVIAHIETHGIFSVLGGLRLCLAAKARAQGGEDKLTDEELVFLAVLELITEVDNGGYRQFFWNSSRRFAPRIVDSLHRIQCERTAHLTARAIAALRLEEVTIDRITEEIQRDNPERNAELEALSREFYSFDEAGPQLVQFVLAERARIQAPRTEHYPRFPRRKQADPAERLILPAEELYRRTKPPTVDSWRALWFRPYHRAASPYVS